MPKSRIKPKCAASPQHGTAHPPARVVTPYGRMTLGCYDVEELDRETLATLVRGLRADMGRRPKRGSRTSPRVQD